MKYPNSPLKGAYQAFEDEMLSRCRLEAKFSLDYFVKDDYEALNYFHANDAIVLHFNDDRHFNNIRANTFVVEIGWHEWYEGAAFLVSANHKGIRVSHLYIQKEEA